MFDVASFWQIINISLNALHDLTKYGHELIGKSFLRLLSLKPCNICMLLRNQLSIGIPYGTFYLVFTCAMYVNMCMYM